jgi:hypothetical protein
LRAAGGVAGRSASVAASKAAAAMAAVAKEPSQMRLFLPGSRISDTHFPHRRRRTPLYPAPQHAPALAFSIAGGGGGSPSSASAS